MLLLLVHDLNILCLTDHLRPLICLSNYVLLESSSMKMRSNEDLLITLIKNEETSTEFKNEEEGANWRG